MLFCLLPESWFFVIVSSLFLILLTYGGTPCRHEAHDSRIGLVCEVSGTTGEAQEGGAYGVLEQDPAGIIDGTRTGDPSIGVEWSEEP